LIYSSVEGLRGHLFPTAIIASGLSIPTANLMMIPFFLLAPLVFVVNCGSASESNDCKNKKAGETYLRRLCNLLLSNLA
jgi:hypothetical protein